MKITPYKVAAQTIYLILFWRFLDNGTFRELLEFSLISNILNMGKGKKSTGTNLNEVS